MLALLSDDAFTVLTPPSSNHRQLWFNTQEGQYTDPRVREALALTLNREQMVATLFEGQAIVANDHPIHPTLPFFDAAVLEQRTADPEKAKQLLADAGFPDGITGDLQVGNLQEIPDMAAIVQQNAEAGGFNLNVSVTDNSDFYGAHWCPGDDEVPTQPCGPSGRGRHRRLRPSTNTRHLLRASPGDRRRLELIELRVSGIRPAVH